MAIDALHPITHPRRFTVRPMIQAMLSSVPAANASCQTPLGGSNCAIHEPAGALPWHHRPMTRLVGINHIALEVGDIEAALTWYGRFFAFELRGRVGDRMAFIDMGDQFIALAAGRTQPPDGARHFGLVVDDKEAVRTAMQGAGLDVGATGSLDFTDPWGNHVQVVDYREIQFTKTAGVLDAMGLGGVEKSEAARRELREKGLSD